MTTLATQRRRNIKASARVPSALAVRRVRTVRHRDHGLHPIETDLGARVVGWVAGGWCATTAAAER